MIPHDDDLVVSVLCAVNAYGDIDPGTSPADHTATRSVTGAFESAAAATAHNDYRRGLHQRHLGQAGCQIVAQGAHDGLSRAISSPHTRFDGDAFIAAATGAARAPSTPSATSRSQRSAMQSDR